MIAALTRQFLRAKASAPGVATVEIGAGDLLDLLDATEPRQVITIDPTGWQLLQLLGTAPTGISVRLQPELERYLYSASAHRWQTAGSADTAQDALDQAAAAFAQRHKVPA